MGDISVDKLAIKENEKISTDPDTSKSKDEQEDGDVSGDAFSLSAKSDKDKTFEKPTSDSFINEIYESMGKQSSSQHDEELSSEEDERKHTDFEPGVLVVKVHGASNLVNKDLVGKSDPYVKIKFRDKVMKTPIIKNTLEPKWNYSTDLLIDSLNEKQINFEVFDEDFGKDSFVGSYSLSLDRAINESLENDWCDLEGCKSGKIQISTTFTKSGKSLDDEPTEKIQMSSGEIIITDENKDLSPISPIKKEHHLTRQEEIEEKVKDSNLFKSDKNSPKEEDF